MTTPVSESPQQPPAEGFAGWLLCFAGIGGLALAAYLRPWAVGLPMGPGLVAGAAIAAGGVWLAPKTAGLSAVVRLIYLLHYAAIAGIASAALLLPLLELVPSYFLHELCVGGFAAAAPWTIAHLLAASSSRWRVSLSCAALGAVVGLAALQPSAWLWPLLVVAIAALAQRVPPTIADEPETAPGGLFNATAFLLFNAIVALGLLPVLGLFLMWLYSNADPDAQAPWVPLSSALSASSFGTPVWAYLALRWIGMTAGFLVPLLVAMVVPERSAPGLRRREVTGAALCLLAAGLLGGQTFLRPGLAALAAGVLLTGMATVSLLAIGRSLAGRFALGLLGGAVGATLLTQIVAVPTPAPVWSLLFWLLEAIALGALWLLAFVSGIAWLRKREGVSPTSA